MIEIQFNKPDDFLKIKETLTRIGVVATYSKTLWQTCHILNKKGKYYILHFKELLQLDGKLKTSMNEQDINDRNFIVYFLEKIGMCTVISELDRISKTSPGKLKILKSSEKNDWILKAKYLIGEESSRNIN